MSSKKNKTINQHFIIEIGAGNTTIFNEFYNRNFIPVRHYVITNGGTLQEAEDIFQNAVMLMYQKAESETLQIHTASIHTYFYAICKNMWRNELQRNKKFISENEPIEMANNEISSTEEQQVYENRYQLFQTYFQQLSKSRKQLLQLVMEGNSMKEVARKMGYSEGYARKKKFEVKKALLEKLYSDELYWELAG